MSIHPRTLTSHRRDLWQLRDDLTVLKNPRKGWYWHYVDNGFARKEYRDAIPESDFLEDFPGLNHLYLRFDWSDVEKEKGIYDWSAIDQIMDAWGAKGYQFSFRPCTFEGTPVPFATPEWAVNDGLPGTFVGDKRKAFEPDYGSEMFLERIGLWLEAMGKRYNTDPRLEFIDVGTYGTWGEGHTAFGTHREWPPDVIIKHINLHLKHFPDKVVMFNDDFVSDRVKTSPEDEQIILDYAVSKGMGLRDDSICVRSYCEKFGYNTLATEWMYDLFWRNAPVDIELEHYTAIKDEHLKSGFPFLQALTDTHATYAGFHGYPRPWLEKHRHFTEYAANKLGYWYFLNAFAVSHAVSGLPAVFTFEWENKGFAPCYTKYDFKIKLKGDGAEYILPTETDNRRFMPGEKTIETVITRLPEMPPGGYTLSVGLFDGTRPIKLALKESICTGGFYELGNIICAS
jgi:hypothetical protein